MNCRDRNFRCLASLLSWAICFGWPALAAAQSLELHSGLSPEGLPLRGPAQGVGIVQRLGEALPLDAEFTDDQGKTVKLGNYFHRDKPVVLVLSYYQCPMLCTQVLNGLLVASQSIPLQLDRDYEIVTVSIDPKETPKLAAAKKKHYVKMYARPGAAEGWHFLTGGQASIDALATAVGFHYRWDEPSQNFAHGSGIMVATPDGRLSHYFYGIKFEPPSDLRLALTESSGGKIGSPVDRVLLLCFHYDPNLGKYGWAIANLFRAGGVLTIVLLGGFIGRNLWRERKTSAQISTAEGSHVG